MKTQPLTTKFLVALALSAVLPAAYAAQVDVTWDSPDTYSDLRATSDSQRKFQERVLTDLESYFRKAGEQLPADQTLSVNVTDVDLAGYVEYFIPNYPFGIRVIRDLDFPRMDLSYELKDADGNILSTGSGRIRDMGFRFPTFDTRLVTPLDYEKRMIDHWYQDNF